MAAPTHELIIQRKGDKHSRTRAGVAWTTEEGWFSLKLNPGIVLSAHDLEDCYLSLYPRGKRQPAEPPSPPPPTDDESEIPF